MATPRERQTTQQTLLQGGGLGAILTGAVIGYSPAAAQGYGAVSGFRQQEDAAQVDLMSRYADLDLKARELQRQDMEIEVLQAEQDGRVANAKTMTERAIAVFDNIEQLKGTDKNKMVLDAVNAQKAVDDSSRQAIAQMADTVNDQQSHTQAVQRMEQIADQAGIPFETMFPGMTREWRGKETVAAYQANKNIATSTQEVQQTERLENQKFKMTTERDQFLTDVDFEKQYRGFIYDSLLQQQRLQMQLEMQKLKNIGPGPIKKSQLESIKPDDVAKLIREQITTISDEFNIFELGESEEFVALGAEAATRVSGIVDEGILRHNQNPQIPPITQAQAIGMVIEEFVGQRIGVDGKIYAPNSRELLNQKEDWMRAFISIHSQNESEFQNMTESQQRQYAEAAWSDIDIRRRMQE